MGRRVTCLAVLAGVFFATVYAGVAEDAVTARFQANKGLLIVNGDNAAGDDFTINPNDNRVLFRRNNLGLFTLDIGTVENLDVNGQGGDDVISGSTGLAGLVFRGGDGNDTLFGWDGNDVLLAGNGNDNLNGGADTDFCDGGTGTDSAINCETGVNVP